MKNHDFQKGKMVAVRRFLNNFLIFYGGDLMKNHDFQKGKMVADGFFFTNTCVNEINFGNIFCVYQRFLLYLLGSKD